MSSSESADWLLNNYPRGAETWGEALLLIDHLTFKRVDQRRLAEHYLAGLPYAQPSIYEVFLRKLPLKAFIEITERYLPSNEARMDLLAYHLTPLLQKAARSEQDRALVSIFLERLQADLSDRDARTDLH